MNQKLRKIFVIGIIGICVLCINLAVFFKFTERDKSVNKKEEVIVDTVELAENFNNIFDNKVDYQDNIVPATLKKDSTKDVVYTIYTSQEQKSEQYELNVNIPRININNNNINNINDNILSLVIISNLKEENNSQREIVKTYNYNISSNQILEINQVLNYREFNNNQVQEKINNTIKESARKATAYNKLGYSKYIRDINDNMYKVENTKVFFLGEGKALYIIYPYGNSNYTTELDLVVM